MEFNISPDALDDLARNCPGVRFGHALGTFNLEWFAMNGWWLRFRMKVPSPQTIKVRPQIYFHKGPHRLNIKIKSLYWPPASQEDVLGILGQGPVALTLSDVAYVARNLDDVLSDFDETDVLAAINQRIRGRLRMRPRRKRADMGNVISLMERLERRPASHPDEDRIRQVLSN